MFVLSRKEGEQVNLRILAHDGKPDINVILTVKKIGRRKVKLLFDASETVVIERPDYLSKIGGDSYGAKRARN